MVAKGRHGGSESLNTRAEVPPPYKGNVIKGGIFTGAVVQGEQVFASIYEPVPVPVALAQLPAPTAGFTGRSVQLDILAAVLATPATASTAIVAIAGLAGVGKTALAIAAGHAARNGGLFRGGTLFIDLHGYDASPVLAASALDALLRSLGVPAERIPLSEEERAGVYRSVLADVGRPVLLILDNASSEAQVRPLLPGEGPHKVVVTSRNTLAGLGARLLEVGALDNKSGADLLDAALRIGRPEDDRISRNQDAGSRLATECGGLPLALQIVAAILKADPSIDIDELAVELAEGASRLDLLVYDDGATHGSPSVAAAFGLSYARLEADAARIFRLLSVNPSSDLSREAAVALSGTSDAKVRRSLSSLARAHLIDPAPGASGRWRMHDLVRLYSRRLSELHAVDDGLEQALDRLLGYYMERAADADFWVRALPASEVPGYFSSRDDALAWLDAEVASLTSAVGMALDAGRDTVAYDLASSIVSYLSWRRRMDEWLTVSELRLSASRRIGDPDKEGAALVTLAFLLSEIRRFDDAMAASRQAATIFRESGSRLNEAKSLGNLGLALLDTRRFEEAVEVSQEVVAIVRELGNSQHISRAVDNLGLCLREAGRFEEAISEHLCAIEICKETGDRDREGAAWTNLGQALREAGRSDEAISAHEQAIEICIEQGDRYTQAISAENLGAALIKAQRLDEAIVACQDAAEIYGELADRHGEATSWFHLGNALRLADRVDESVAALRIAAEGFRDTDDSFAQAEAVRELGLALQRAERRDDAVAAFESSAALFGESSSAENQRIALSLRDKCAAEGQP